MDKYEKKIEQAAEVYAEPYMDKNRRNSVMIAFKRGAMSKEAREYHTRSMYTEEEVIELLTKRAKSFSTDHPKFNAMLIRRDINWFNKNKK